ncbi:hypothetical protein ACFFTN_23115 [Aminobacter aganoensis]|uniref:HEPN domain-containing protein n=1 Tax=Aminobacter aganoensis TaxID=83264 RepID=A0A7X0FAG3_9HYPH|nr:hypothetical protein [Aminobacter aganoensis]MBB6356106.1 hypothetical protein [Aminobacter aganoensis]
MLELKGKDFLFAMNQLSELNEIGKMDSKYLVEHKEQVSFLNSQLREELKKLNLPLSIIVTNRIEGGFNLWSNGKYSSDTVASNFSKNIVDLRARIEDELENSVIYCLSPSEAVFARATEPPFGVEVFDKFQDAATDIEEARKCMAFARWTGAVFHLMRAMELGLTLLGGKLGATVQNAHGGSLSWGIILSNLDGRIEQLPKGEERNRWSQARALLYHVNQCWRTETMHPKQTYTEEEARAVYDATGSFLRYLSGLV